MIDKERLTRHIVNMDDKIFVIRMLNLAESVSKNYRIRYSGFCDPYQVSLCIPVLSQLKELRYCVLGGYEKAERKIIVMFPDFLEGIEDENPLSVLKLEGKLGENTFNHRDILGAILGLGIKREKLGDIIVWDHCAYIISFKEICNFIQMNLQKISRYSITAHEVGCQDVQWREGDSKLIETTVSSLRLDAIMGAGFGESRSAISKLINNDRVKVNWKAVNNPSYAMKEGDVVSFKGKGRMILLEVGDKTKKDRYKIILKRMI